MGWGKVSMKEDLCGNMVLGRPLCSHPQRGQKRGTLGGRLQPQAAVPVCRLVVGWLCPRGPQSAGAAQGSQPMVPVRCWTPCTHLGSGQRAHTAGHAAAPPLWRQLSAPAQLPANSSFNFKRNNRI